MPGKEFMNFPSSGQKKIQESVIQREKKHYLVCVDNDLALFLVGAGDDEHVVEAGGVVDQTLVLVGGQHIAGARLQEVNSTLVHSQPEILRPVGGEGLLELVQLIEETFQ